MFAFPVKVMRFNRERAAPDVSQEELSHTYSVTNAPTETGFRYSSFTQAPTEVSLCLDLSFLCGDT